MFNLFVMIFCGVVTNGTCFVYAKDGNADWLMLSIYLIMNLIQAIYITTYILDRKFRLEEAE